MSRPRKIRRIKVEELRLLNFRSFSNARLPLSSNLTTIIGHNGSGKTTLLDAFDFVREALSLGLLTAVNKRGGIQSVGHRQANGQPASPSIAIKLTIGGNSVVYGFSIEAGTNNFEGFAIEREVFATADGKHTFTFDRNGFRSSERVGRPAIIGSSGGRQQSLLLPLIAEQDLIWRTTYHALLGLDTYSFAPSVIRRGQIAGNYLRLERDGSNAGDVLYTLQKQFSEQVDEQLHTEIEALQAVGAEINELTRTESDYEKLSAETQRRIKEKEDEKWGLEKVIEAKTAIIRASSSIGWLEEKLKEITPGIVKLDVNQSEGRNVIHFIQEATGTRGTTYQNNFTTFDISDGTLRGLAMLLALRQQPTPALVLIDEIEDSIHPYALSTLVSAAYVSTENFQVVITSHSPEVLSYPSIAGEDVRVIEWWDGSSGVYKLHPKVLQVLSESRTVGDMLNRNSLRITDELTIDEANFFNVNEIEETNSAAAAALGGLLRTSMRHPKKPLLIAIVEGYGDAAAVPLLLRRWFQLCGIDWEIKPIRAGKVDEESVADLVKNEVAVNDPHAILIIRDNDGDCPRYKKGLGPTLKRVAQKAAGNIKVGVVIADYCYEAWLMACWEGFEKRIVKVKPHASMRTGEMYRADCQSLKSELAFIRGIKNRRYDERNDQPELSAALPLDPATQAETIKRAVSRVPSYGKLLRVLEELTERPIVSSAGIKLKSAEA